MRTAVVPLLGLACLFTGWLLGFVMPGSRLFSWTILALGATLMTVSLVIHFRRPKSALVSRRTRLGVSATVESSLFLGVILLANAICVGTHYRFDFTGSAQFTLTSQTKNVLRELDESVEVVTFFTPSDPLQVTNYVGSLLAEYQNFSDRLTVKSFDPDLNPDRARLYGVDKLGALYGVVVFRGDAGRKQVFAPQILAEAERAFTGAILEVTGTKQKIVYFLSGHGESSIHSDYSSIRSSLQDNLFQVEELDLLVSPGVPEDCAVLVIPGPQERFTAGELDMLKEFVRNKGRVFLLLNPNPPAGLSELVSEWWFDVVDGTIVDPASYISPDKDIPLIPRTRNSFGIPDIYFPGATALFPQERLPDGIRLDLLVWTSSESWLEKDLFSGEMPVFEEQVDKKGPLAIGAFISTAPVDGNEASSEPSLVVLGDSDFAANQHSNSGGNGELFLACVKWLAADREVVSVDRKVLPVRRLVLTPEEVRFLHVSAIGLLPLLLLIVGVYVWWRRR